MALRCYRRDGRFDPGSGRAAGHPVKLPPVKSGMVGHALGHGVKLSDVRLEQLSGGRPSHWWAVCHFTMKKKTVAVGDNVFVIAENEETLEISGEHGEENFMKALKKTWPDDE